MHFNTSPPPKKKGGEKNAVVTNPMKPKHSKDKEYQQRSHGKRIQWDEKKREDGYVSGKRKRAEMR